MSPATRRRASARWSRWATSSSRRTTPTIGADGVGEDRDQVEIGGVERRTRRGHDEQHAPRPIAAGDRRGQLLAVAGQDRRGHPFAALGERGDLARAVVDPAVALGRRARGRGRGLRSPAGDREARAARTSAGAAAAAGTRRSSRRSQMTTSARSPASRIRSATRSRSSSSVVCPNGSAGDGVEQGEVTAVLVGIARIEEWGQRPVGNRPAVPPGTGAGRRPRFGQPWRSRSARRPRGIAGDRPGGSGGRRAD